MRKFHDYIRFMKSCQLTDAVKHNVDQLVFIQSKFIPTEYYFHIV